MCAAPGASTKSEEAAVNKINEVGSLFSLARGTEGRKNRRFLRIPSCDSPLSIHGPRLSPWNILIWCLSLKRHDRTLSLETSLGSNYMRAKPVSSVHFTAEGKVGVCLGECRDAPKCA